MPELIPQGKVMHLTIDYQTIGKWEKGRQVHHMSSEEVSKFIADIDYHQLVGRQEKVDTLTVAIKTSQTLQRLESKMDHPAKIWQAQTHLQESITAKTCMEAI